jgi:hypothetical protein
MKKDTRIPFTNSEHARKKFGIVCRTKEDFEKIKNRYPKVWQEEYEFVWIESENLSIAGKEIDTLVFDDLHVSLDWIGEKS